MKYLLSLLLIICITACSHTGGQAVKNVSKKVSQCCTAITLSKTTEPDKQAAIPTTEPESISVFTEFVLEKSVHLLTH